MEFGTFLRQVDEVVAAKDAKNLADAFATYKKLGLSFVDVDSEEMTAKGKPAKELYKELQDYGIRVGSVFCWKPFPHEDENILKTMREYTKTQLDYVAALDCKIYMPVPFVGTAHKTPQDRQACQDKVIAYVNDVVELAKPYGIQVVMENYSTVTCPFATTTDIEYIMSQMPDVQYVLDCGNFWFNGSDVLDAADRFRDKIAHVHLKDIVTNPTGALQIDGRAGDCVAIGAGEIPFDKIFALLKQIGYDKTMTIEINDADGMYEKTKASLEFLQQAVK
ncbi:MAG: sugar phosphate isomerase/epimerase [Clostridia bacterium]|nr:sugar phosphate isomerase/epimerase [Clostridia bacterium]